jgi:tRNA uridine 5-carboxymethylaminomethyl modification enzyme
MIERTLGTLQRTRLSPATMSPDLIQRLFPDGPPRDVSLVEILKRPGWSYGDIASHVEGGTELAGDVALQVEISVKYQGYIERQQEQVERQRRYEDTPLPDDLDYDQVTGLSFEARHKLSQHRPDTLGQAGRISGITPAAIALLLVHLKRRSDAVSRSA